MHETLTAEPTQLLTLVSNLQTLHRPVFWHDWHSKTAQPRGPNFVEDQTL